MVHRLADYRVINAQMQKLTKQQLLRLAKEERRRKCQQAEEEDDSVGATAVKEQYTCK
jgi:hypothetical protein